MNVLHIWTIIFVAFCPYSNAYEEPPGITTSSKKPIKVSRLSWVTTFGGTTNSSGKGVNYFGNVGDPYGSNIIDVSDDVANRYKYVRFEGPVTGEGWTVVIWNKIGPDGSLGGWYGYDCRKFTLMPGQIRYIAIDENSQGAWAAAPGASIPVDTLGGYAATWGEFDFGSAINSGWSGFDVSAIAAQNAGLPVQGMKICDVLSGICSYITKNAAIVNNAYVSSIAGMGGIGGNLSPGPLRLLCSPSP